MTVQLPHRFIVVEGPIGAGKTSLARRLAEAVGGELLLEEPEANPFLARFYDDPARHALATQIFFLFQRIEQLRATTQLDFFRRTIVSDFLFDKDPLFASLTLGADELALYRRIYEMLAPQAPRPDLVIFLQAPTATLVERIRRRGRDYERNLTIDATGEAYLERLVDAYAHFQHHYDAAPALVVNSANLNFVDDERHFAMLVERIGAIRGGREYFNLG